MYNFNKKRFLSILIFPLLFNGCLSGMDGYNEENNQKEHIKWHKEQVLEQKKLNAKPMLEKLGIKDNEYGILGSGAYGMVIKPKNSDYIWKLTYATIKNGLDGELCERFHPEYSASQLKDKKYNNICEILGVRTLEDGNRKRYSGENDKPYNLAIKMQFVSGKTLGEYIKDKSKTDEKFTISKLYTLIYRVCDVLEKFRNNGLIYSDVKEENIMVGEKTNDFVIIDVDSATTPKVTRKNYIDASEGEKQNMDLIMLIEMALRIVHGNKVNNENQFDLINFEGNNIKQVENQFSSIYKEIKGGMINNIDNFKKTLCKN